MYIIDIILLHRVMEFIWYQLCQNWAPAGNIIVKNIMWLSLNILMLKPIKFSTLWERLHSTKIQSALYINRLRVWRIDALKLRNFCNASFQLKWFTMNYMSTLTTFSDSTYKATILIFEYILDIYLTFHSYEFHNYQSQDDTL